MLTNVNDKRTKHSLRGSKGKGEKSLATPSFVIAEARGELKKGGEAVKSGGRSRQGGKRGGGQIKGRGGSRLKH